MSFGTRYASGTQKTGYKQLVLFSTEKPTKPQFRGDATSPGTCSFVPPVAGFILAAHVLRTILEVPEQ